MTDIILIAHNVRSCHNVGSLLRTAEGLGLTQVWLTGYTPYPAQPGDKRLPHLAQKITKQISKTALGAEELLDIKQSSDISSVINSLKADNYEIWGLEQSKSSIELSKFAKKAKIAVLVGNEVTGVKPELLEMCDGSVEIPMLGQKESFNVAQAAAMALYHLRAMD